MFIHLKWLKMILCREIQHTQLSAPFAKKKKKEENVSVLKLPITWKFHALHTSVIQYAISHHAFPPPPPMMIASNLRYVSLPCWCKSYRLWIYGCLKWNLSYLTSATKRWSTAYCPRLSVVAVTLFCLHRGVHSISIWVLGGAEGNRMVLSWKRSSIPVCCWRRWDDCFGNAS